MPVFVAPIQKMLNQPKIVNPISSKNTTTIFLINLPSTPFIFTLWYLNTFWAHVVHVLDMLWVLRVCNMSLGMLSTLWNIHNMEGYECKTCPSITQFFPTNPNNS